MMSGVDIVALMFLMFFLACISFALGGMKADNNNEYQQKVLAAIEECEASLPRDQHCDVVITAVVIKKGNV